MADNKRGTLYQSLNQIFNWSGVSPDAKLNDPNKAQIVIKGNSPDDIIRKGLEIQQKRDLQNKFFKTTERGFQKAMQYEAARLPAYMDFEGMEYYPIIASALDLFMEESTTIGDSGKMLSIYSQDGRIKYHLEELFYNILNVNVNLPFWIRNMPVKWDSIIPLLNGESITIKEISERLKKNPETELWTYSIQDKTKNVLPGKIIWCDLTRKNSEIIRVYLDNESYMETAPDHEFLMRNGTYKKAEDLKPKDSLMPFYTKISEAPLDDVIGYEKIYNPSSNHYKFTHGLIAHECCKDIEKEKLSNERYCTHHKDFNKLNNNPNNLLRMTIKEHVDYHWKHSAILKRKDVTEKRMKGIDKYLRSQERRDRMSEEMMGIYPKYFNDYNNSELHDKHNIIRKEAMLKHWSDENYRKKMKDKMELKLNNTCLNYIIRIIDRNKKYVSINKICKMLSNDNIFMELFKKTNSHIKKDLSRSMNTNTFSNLIFRFTGLLYQDFVLTINPDIADDEMFIRTKNIINAKAENEKNKLLNHKVLYIERIDIGEDVYCMEVVGPNNEQDRHNFPICGKDKDGKTNRNGVFVSNCKYGDNWILLYGERGEEQRFTIAGLARLTIR